MITCETSTRLEYEFTIDSMVSTNDMYIQKPKKTKSGKLTAYRTKSYQLRDFQNKMKDILEDNISDLFINSLKSIYSKDNGIIYGLKIDSIYYMPIHNYENSDVSNYVKAYEDCISSRLKGNSRSKNLLDDKNNVEYNSRKEYIGIDEDTGIWKVSTVIEVIKKDNKYLEYLRNKGVIVDDTK